MRILVGRAPITPIMAGSNGTSSTSKLSVPTTAVDCEPMSLFGILRTDKEDNKSKKRSNNCTGFLENAFHRHWPSALSIKPQEEVDSMAIINTADREIHQHEESVGDGDIEQTRVPPYISTARQRATPSLCVSQRGGGDVQTSDSIGSGRAHYAKRLKTPGQENLLGEKANRKREDSSTQNSHRAQSENLGDGRATTTKQNNGHTFAKSSTTNSKSSPSSLTSPPSPSATAAAITTSNPVLKDSPSNMLKGQPNPSLRSYASSSRPRSRAIAIKRRSNNYFNMYSSSQYDEFPTNQSENTSEKMYDWATWRMYNRIVDHRRNQQRIKARNGSTSASGSVTQAGGLFPITADSASALDTRNDDAYETEVFGSCDYIHDGEVFELDDI